MELISKFDYKTLSIHGQLMWKFCRQILRDLKNGEYTDEQISRFLSSITAEKNGFINPENYFSAEKAMKFIGVHRNQFFALIKEHNVKCRKINGHPIGYHRDDLQRMKNSLNKPYI